jgi:dATP pyrophosphohydrolase
MARAPIQILVLPYRKTSLKEFEFLVLYRSDLKFWQGIAGGAEDEEQPLEAAKREAFEETGISRNANYLKLDSFSTVPANVFKAWKTWPQGTFVVPEYYFAVDATHENIRLSNEHAEFRWCNFELASSLLRFDSNRNALWELKERLKE